MTVSESTILIIALLLFALAAGPGLVGLWFRYRDLSERIDDLESLRLLDAAEIARTHREIVELRRGVAILIAQVRRAGMQPEWTPELVTEPAAHGQQAETDKLVELWQRIAERFSREEMQDLAFELGLPVSHAESDGAMARDIVSAAKRRDKLEELQRLCRRLRPEGGF